MADVTTGNVYKLWLNTETFDVEARDGEMSDNIDVECSGTWGNEEDAQAAIEALSRLIHAETDLEALRALGEFRQLQARQVTHP